nr:hypothetical protein BaRGS_020401 [Batillaria attramentaria]
MYITTVMAQDHVSFYKDHFEFVIRTDRVNLEQKGGLVKVKKCRTRKTPTGSDSSPPESTTWKITKCCHLVGKGKLSFSKFLKEKKKNKKKKEKKKKKNKKKKEKKKKKKKKEKKKNKKKKEKEKKKKRQKEKKKTKKKKEKKKKREKEKKKRKKKKREKEKKKRKKKKRETEKKKKEKEKKKKKKKTVLTLSQNTLIWQYPLWTGSNSFLESSSS